MSDEHKTDVDDNAGDNQDDDNQTDNQNSDDNQSSDENTSDNSNQNDSDKQDDSKEHNRKGYEQRKSTDGEESVSREEFDKVVDDVSTVKGENEQLKFQKANPWCTDELYKSLEATSKGSGKTMEDIIESDPVWKGHVETVKAKANVDGATASPSTKTTQAKKSDYSNMSSKDFRAKKEEVLQRRGD